MYWFQFDCSFLITFKHGKLSHSFNLSQKNNFINQKTLKMFTFDTKRIVKIPEKKNKLNMCIYYMCLTNDKIIGKATSAPSAVYLALDGIWTVMRNGIVTNFTQTANDVPPSDQSESTDSFVFEQFKKFC